MKYYILKLKHFIQEGKQVLLWFLSGVILSICVITGTNYMSADVEVNNKFLDKVIEYNKNDIPKIDKKLSLISGEAIINDFSSKNELWVDSSINFMSIGQWTLINWKAYSNSVVLIITRDWTECRAKTNMSWKFGCMFSTEKVTEGDLQISYK